MLGLKMGVGKIPLLGRTMGCCHQTGIQAWATPSCISCESPLVWPPRPLQVGTREGPPGAACPGDVLPRGKRLHGCRLITTINNTTICILWWSEEDFKWARAPQNKWVLGVRGVNSGPASRSVGAVC